MPRKKTAPKEKTEPTFTLSPQTQLDNLLRDLIATVRALAPGRTFGSVSKAERYLAEKAKG